MNDFRIPKKKNIAFTIKNTETTNQARLNDPLKTKFRVKYICSILFAYFVNFPNNCDLISSDKIKLKFRNYFEQFCRSRNPPAIHTYIKSTIFFSCFTFFPNVLRFRKKRENSIIRKERFSNKKKELFLFANLTSPRSM